MNSTSTPAPADARTDPKAAQAWFEAQFDHTPATDTRTPAQVAEQCVTEGWR
jgi:hypothetical protein